MKLLLNMPPEMLERLRKISAQASRPIAATIRRAVAEWPDYQVQKKLDDDNQPSE